MRAPTAHGPVHSLTKGRGLAPAGVLAWNRVNGNLLASAHDNQLWVWDVRAGGGLGILGEGPGGGGGGDPGTAGGGAGSEGGGGGAARGLGGLGGGEGVGGEKHSQPAEDLGSDDPSAAAPPPLMGSRCYTKHTRKILDVDWSYVGWGVGWEGGGGGSATANHGR